MSHIEYLVHFCPVCAALFLDGLEQRRNGEKVVFYYTDIFYEMQYSNGNKRTLVRPPVMFKEMGLPEYNRGPYLGEQTESILKEYGYSDEEVAKLLEEGAAIPMDPALRD